MSQLKEILNRPEYVENIGLVYPITIKDYDDFQKPSKLLLYSKDHFRDVQKGIDVEISLYECIALMILQEENYQPYVNDLIRLFELTLHKEVEFNYDAFEFYIKDTNFIINKNTYGQYRDVVMRQNLIFSPKVYKNKFTQMIAEKVLMSKSKNSLDISFEDKISTVVTMSHKTFSDIENWSIYQLENVFQRILQLINYQNSMLFKTVSSEVPNPTHFAEKIDLHINPYDGLFKDKSKLNKLNQAIGK